MASFSLSDPIRVQLDPSAHATLFYYRRSTAHEKEELVQLLKGRNISSPLHAVPPADTCVRDTVEGHFSCVFGEKYDTNTRLTFLKVIPPSLQVYMNRVGRAFKAVPDHVQVAWLPGPNFYMPPRCENMIGAVSTSPVVMMCMGQKRLMEFRVKDTGALLFSADAVDGAIIVLSAGFNEKCTMSFPSYTPKDDMCDDAVLGQMHVNLTFRYCNETSTPPRPSLLDDECTVLSKEGKVTRKRTRPETCEWVVADEERRRRKRMKRHHVTIDPEIYTRSQTNIE